MNYSDIYQEYPYDVTLPIQTVRKDEYTFDLKDEVIEWLKGNMAQGCMIKRPSWDSSLVQIHFRNQEEALLFKLTWGGE